MSINQNKDSLYIKFAFQQAEINLGSTSSNPSVGCIVVKNNSVISSAYTSLNGRPHAEANALKKNLDYKDSKLFVTLEPCSHHGKTPPCVKKIISKKINHVTFSINDNDPRSKNLATKNLQRKKISVKKFILTALAKKFYKSYFLQSLKELPFVDGKLAVSKDYLTINKKNRWITNENSRKLANFIRSRYDCILSTSKTINEDNPLLDCRIESLEKKSPDVVIIDRFFKIKKNLKIFKNKNRKIYIFIKNHNLSKEKYFEKLGVKIIRLKKNSDSKNELKELFLTIKNLGFSRILIETGVTFLSRLLQFKLIKNFYLFKSSFNLRSRGLNNSSPYYIKRIKPSKNNKIKVNLKDDSLYKVKL